jgi:N utilization substance protein B
MLIMTRRSRGREVALQVLYQLEQNPGVPPEAIRRFIERRLLGDAKLVEFTVDLIRGVQEQQPRIDPMIEAVAENWRLDRMAAIDRNILRLGVYELLCRPEVPPRVAINESLELAKRYSTGQSSRFVNGILDRVLQLQGSSCSPDSGEAEHALEPSQPSDVRPGDSDAGSLRGASPGEDPATPLLDQGSTKPEPLKP